MRRKVKMYTIVASLFLSLSLLVACKAQAPQTNTSVQTPEKKTVSSGVLAQFEQELTQIVESVSPSVVTIFATQENQEPDFPFPFPFPFPRERRSLGSGVIIDYKKDKFYILTNSHVVQNATSLKVRFDKHTEKPAKIVGTDPKTDVAVIEVDAKGIENPESRVAKLGNSDELRVGNLVIAIGNPYGLERTVTVGVVSALRRAIGITQYESFIQTDAAINPGNSGGPLVNIKGEVVGINTAILAEAQGLGFAIPINLAKWVADQLIQKGKVIRGWLGVVIQDVTPEMAESLGVKEGVIIAQVAPSSPAEKAGLKIGDVVVEVNGQKVGDVRDLQFTIMKTPPGQEVVLRVVRDGKELTIKAKVAQMPDEVGQKEPTEGQSTLGLVLRNLTPEEVQRFGAVGVLVLSVAPNSLAMRSGLRAGDLILRVNNRPVASVEEFNSIIDSLIRAGRETALLLIRRGSNNLFITLRLR